MKKILRFIAIFLSIVSLFSLIGCFNNSNNEDTTNNNTSSNKEVVELTKSNWKEYLAYQESSITSPVTQSSLLGYPYYKSDGTYTIKFYSKSNVKFENVNIKITLYIFSLEYASEDKSSISLKDRSPDDWYFASKPIPRKDNSLGATFWEIIKNGTLSNNGEISFSEPCKMSFLKSSWKTYGTLEDAIDFYIEEISGQIIIEK